MDGIDIAVKALNALIEVAESCAISTRVLAERGETASYQLSKIDAAIAEQRAAGVAHDLYEATR